jgi:hypothetical protein
VGGGPPPLPHPAAPPPPAAAWIGRQRALWERKFDAVERYLGEAR